MIGEDQILGQMKRAFDFSRMNHYAGSDLSMIFDKALRLEVESEVVQVLTRTACL